KVVAYDISNSPQQFLHRCAVARPQIQGMALAVLQQMLERARMRIGKIENVNEVTYTGSVSRVVVCAQDLKMRSAAQSSFDCNGNGVRFGRMPFANSSFRIGPGSVEIAQNE